MTYEKLNTKERPEIVNILPQLTSFERIKDRIIYKLVSKDSEQLADRPYIPYLNLAIIFLIALDIADKEIVSIPIRNNFLPIWNVEAETLMDFAHKNTPLLLPLTFKSMESVIKEFKEDVTSPDAEECPPFFILSNKSGCWGATSILYDGILKQIAEELQSDYFIIPSSVHETIIFSDDYLVSKYELYETIRNVNENVVSSREFLSDFPYYYDRNQEKLLIP